MVFLMPVLEVMPWDFLRSLTDLALNSDALTRWIVLLLSLFIAGIAFLAYRRAKSKKLLFVLAAFSLFAFKWLLSVADLYISPGWFFGDPSQNVVEFFALLLLFLAIFRKK